MELTGKIKLINDTQTFDSGFTKREFVVTTHEQYPQDIKFECVKDRTALLDNFGIGDGVSVQFNIRGNEYQEKYYVNLQAWKIDKAEDGHSELPSSDDSIDTLMPDDDKEDDLPF